MTKTYKWPAGSDRLTRWRMWYGD